MEDNKNLDTTLENGEQEKTYSTAEVQKMIEEGRKQALEEVYLQHLILVEILIYVAWTN